MSTPNMVLDVPTPGITPGPTYAQQISNDLNVIDAHDHSLGKGAPVPLISSGGLHLDANQKVGVALDGTSLALTAFGLKVNDISGVITTGAIGAPSANGLTITGTTLAVTAADATHPGSVTTAAQTLAGLKTFQDGIAASTAALTAITGNSVTANGGLALSLIGALAAASGSADVVLGSQNTRTAGTIVQVKNNASSLFTIGFDGTVSTLALSVGGNYHQTAGTLFSDSLSSQSAATLALTSSAPDGVGALGFALSTANTLTGGKVLSVQNNGSERMAVTFDGRVLASTGFDTPAAGTLTVGGTNATEVDIGTGGNPVKVLGLLMASSLDTAAAAILSIGTSTATQVSISRTGQLTRVYGNLQVDGTVAMGTIAMSAVQATSLDTASAVPLVIGATNASEVDIGHVGIMTNVLGTFMCDAGLDTMSAVALAIGGATATEVDLGRSGQTVKVLGNLKADTGLDTVTGVTLAIGGATATEVDIGRSGQTVKILGNLAATSSAAIGSFGANVGSSAVANQTAKNYLGPDGRVYLAGRLISTSGTVTAGSTLTTLAAAYRPNRTVILPVNDSSGAAGYVTITSAGVLTCSIALVSGGAELHLDNIEFTASN